MTSTRPYLIRAIYDWILDNQMTPHILVDSRHADVVVPRQYEEDHKIVLNISPSASQGLSLGDDAVAFNARFDGSPMQVYIPIQYVLAIYTRENGQGMMFNEEEGSEPNPDPDSPTQQPTEQSSTGASVKPSSKSSKPSKAHLKVVK